MVLANEGREAKLKGMFQQLDLNKDKRLDAHEVQQVFKCMTNCLLAKYGMLISNHDMVVIYDKFC